MTGRNKIVAALPAASDTSIIIEDDQTVSDIISTIGYMHKKNSPYYDRIAGNFIGATTRDTCENIFDFCKANIPYEEQGEDFQTVRSPQRILKAAAQGIGNDCKHYASFIGGVLDALRRKGKQIRWTYRFASYKIFDPTPGHVFVVVKDDGEEIWIDPVLDHFDFHKPYISSIDKNMQSTLGTPGRMGAVSMGADNKTAATLQTIGGTICAIAPTVAACIPVGTVVAACAEVVGFAIGFIGKMFAGKYQYSTQVRWLTQNYMMRVRGVNVSSDNDVDEKYVQMAQMWHAAVLGVPIWDNLRVHALRGTTSDTDRNVGASIDQRVKWYQAFGSVEASVPYEAIAAAAKIAGDLLDDHMGLSAWAGYPPANIVLQQEGITAEQAVEKASGVLTGSAPYSAPSTTVFTDLENSGVIIPIIIGAGALLLIANNSD